MCSCMVLTLPGVRAFLVDVISALHLQPQLLFGPLGKSKTVLVVLGSRGVLAVQRCCAALPPMQHR
jgi:hypothetical protein